MGFGIIKEGSVYRITRITKENMGIAIYRIVNFPLWTIERYFSDPVISPVILQLDDSIAFRILGALPLFIQKAYFEGIFLILLILALDDRIAILTRNNITVPVHPGILNDSFFLVDQGHEAQIVFLRRDRHRGRKQEENGQEEEAGLFHESVFPSRDRIDVTGCQDGLRG